MAPHKPIIRDAAPFLRHVRAILMGRDHMLNNRWPTQQAARTQPDPALPTGCSDNLSANYYYTRDGRRHVGPPEVVATNSKATNLLIGAPSTEAAGEKSVTITQKKPKLPGTVYDPPCELNL